MTLWLFKLILCLHGSYFPDEGIELKTNEIYGLTTPSERSHIHGHNPGSETLCTEYDYITTNAYL